MFHYPQPPNGHRRELPMVGARPSFAACGDGTDGGLEDL
jgi:hypothetical protein